MDPTLPIPTPSPPLPHPHLLTPHSPSLTPLPPPSLTLPPLTGLENCRGQSLTHLSSRQRLPIRQTDPIRGIASSSCARYTHRPTPSYIPPYPLTHYNTSANTPHHAAERTQTPSNTHTHTLSSPSNTPLPLLLSPFSPSRQTIQIHRSSRLGCESWVLFLRGISV